MLAGPRLRQVALVARDRDRTAAQLQEAFGWSDPFHDPAIGQFGLVNAVFAVGSSFVEVVAPAREGTTAGRYLERRGGDSGYMAIFQVADIGSARRRIDDLGLRVVWKADRPDIAGTHLHPKDTPGAIVSIDWADPPESWRWAGPQWTGGAPDAVGSGGIAGLTIEVADPAASASRWAAVVGVPSGENDEDGEVAIVPLADAGQILRFVPAADGRGEGITEVRLTGGPPARAEIAGVLFTVEPPEGRP